MSNGGVVISFIKDFWREIMVFLFVLYAIISFLYILNQRSRIEDLKSDTDTQQQDTADADNLINGTDATPQQQQTVEEEKPKFSVELPTGWVLDSTIPDTDTQPETSTYSNGDKKIDLIVSPGATVVASDITWAFDYTQDASDSTKHNLTLTDTNEVFCVQGDELCTYGDGRLQVQANGSQNPSDKVALAFFFTDDSYAPDGDSFTSLQEFIEAVTL